MTISTLTTDRLVLRPWREADLPSFAALNAHAEVMRYFPSVLSKEESDALARRIMTLMEMQGFGMWAVEHKKEQCFLGYVGLHRPQGLPFSPCTEVGWRLHTSFWGQGYATEAAGACLAFAFTHLQEERILAFTAVSNERSQAVMRRLGMRHIGAFEHPRVPEGHVLRPHVLYALTRKEWVAQA